MPFINILQNLKEKGIVLNKLYHTKSKLSNTYDIQEILEQKQSRLILKALHKQTNQQYIIKCINKSALVDSNTVQQLINEIVILNEAQHQNLIGLEEIYEYEDDLFIIMEFAEDGDLYKLISENDAEFTENQILAMIFGIVKASQFLHKRRIIHQDIKLENVFLRKNIFKNQFTPLLGDFGIAEFIPQLKKDNNEIINGSPGYICPEKFLSDYDYSYPEAIDVYSIGCIFYILTFKAMPFSGKDYDSILVANKRGEIQWNTIERKHPEVNKHLITLLKSMLEKDPSKRATIKDILNNHLFLKFQFKNFKKQQTLPQIQFQIGSTGSMGSQTSLKRQYSSFKIRDDTKSNLHKSLSPKKKFVLLQNQFKQSTNNNNGQQLKDTINNIKVQLRSKKLSDLRIKSINQNFRASFGNQLTSLSIKQSYKKPIEMESFTSPQVRKLAQRSPSQKTFSIKGHRKLTFNQSPNNLQRIFLQKNYQLHQFSKQ